ncbi:MAG TPA: 50S ribosomal protein L4 [Thermodesulfobacteriota bacterium]|nr:50S ribosomal protein L4 [Deltaproteobacteria bacterium]HNR14036.1 50S ribosomal protein L4 [Thermodesulfobacteriota bacterium]HNU70648.1 50S ribosomal protein L4 [Thermodesulfobacteriota bacterium]HQO77031.1 50S ribosomal protein L4 [Thermodesulfobacteriota bacterium]
MPAVEIVDKNKTKVGEAQLADDIFGVSVKPYLMNDVVKMQLANRRRGTAQTKNRALITGGGKKPWRQKGTGRARAGSSRSPLWKGGATVFGPVPRDYSYKVPKKVRQSALRSVLTQKLNENRLVIVDGLALDGIKTKSFVAMMQTLQIPNALIIDVDNTNLELSARNVPNFRVLRPQGLNVYDALRFDYLVITKSSLEYLGKRLSA